MLQVAFGQSKYYSDNLSENVKRGIRQKLRRGEWPGLAPFGYVNNPKTRTIEPEPTKSRCVAKAFEEFSQGRHTLESLGQRLSFWGVVSGTGKPLCKATLQRMLTNKAYLGLIVHNGERETIGTNRRLLSKQVLVGLRPPFDLIPKQKGFCEARPAEGGASEQPVASEFSKCLNWSGIWESNPGHTAPSREFYR